MFLSTLLVSRGSIMAPKARSRSPHAGALNKREKHDFVRANIPKEKLDQIALAMPICMQHRASATFDPMIRRAARPCRDGPLCKRLHLLEDTPLGRQRCAQVNNLPFVSVYRTSTKGEHKLDIRTPLENAFQLFDSKLAQGIGTTRFPRCLEAFHTKLLNQVAHAKSSTSKLDVP